MKLTKAQVERLAFYVRWVRWTAYAALVIAVWGETGPWTALFAALTTVTLELQARLHRESYCAHRETRITVEVFKRILMDVDKRIENLRTRERHNDAT